MVSKKRARNQRKHNFLHDLWSKCALNVDSGIWMQLMGDLRYSLDYKLDNMIWHNINEKTHTTP